MTLIVFFLLGKKTGKIIANRNWYQKIPGIRKNIANSSRSIIKGQVVEQLAPYLPNFPFNPAECKFFGSPIDFVVFQDIENEDKAKVIFVEVKTGQAGLNSNERNLRSAIEHNRVYWYEYRIN